MIHFEQFELPNGLKVIVHEDPQSSMVCLNLLYKVGSRNEASDKTGFAHLFEHLMFGGSRHIPNFDGPLQLVGGDNNAFTSTDITNYYITVPAHNVETAFWLESDRMLSLSFDPKVLEVQRKVVLEEFKQRYLNQPYGDIWHHIRPMAYTQHPYAWPTIGKELSHIEQATMQDVKGFFGKFYVPGNAVLVLAGGITVDRARMLAEKWFGPIPAGAELDGALPVEPAQTSRRHAELEADVPANAFYKVFHMCDRMAPEYYATDLLSDILGRGKSSRFHRELVKEKGLFHNVSSYITGSASPGLFVISGKLAEDVSFDQAEQGIGEIVDRVITGGVSEEELTRVKNQAESSTVFGELEVLNRAMGLAYGDFLGDPDLANKELDHIRRVKHADLQQVADKILIDNNCSSLYYKKRVA